MSVDVSTHVVIHRPRDAVARYASDPAHAPRWYVNIRTATLQTPGPLREGSQVAFSARFLGRTLEYTYEVVTFAPGERLIMRTREGPFPMETTYTWESVAEGSTRMTLRNRGEPRGFARVAAPLMAMAMRRANTKDLARLKAILETR